MREPLDAYLRALLSEARARGDAKHDHRVELARQLDALRAELDALRAELEPRVE